MIRRRDFITLLGGVMAWPLAAHAQQGDRVRRIGVFLPGDENDPRARSTVSAFTQALAGLGWTDGRNLRMDLRWGGDDINRIREVANELVGLHPDIILTAAGVDTIAVQRETRTIPIVFAIGGWRPYCRAGWVHRRTHLADRIGGGTKQRTGGLFAFCVCQRGRFALLRTRPGRQHSSCRLLCRSHPTRREAGRSPGAVANQVRDGRQPQDRQGARPYGAAIDLASR